MYCKTRAVHIERMSNNTDLVRPELAPGGILDDLFLPQQDDIVEHKQHPKKFPLGCTHYVDGMERRKREEGIQF